MEDKVREAVITELRRQAEARPAELQVGSGGDKLLVNGPISIDELVAAIVGAVAGGP